MDETQQNQWQFIIDQSRAHHAENAELREKLAFTNRANEALTLQNEQLREKTASYEKKLSDVTNCREALKEQELKLLEDKKKSQSWLDMLSQRAQTMDDKIKYLDNCVQANEKRKLHLQEQKTENESVENNLLQLAKRLDVIKTKFEEKEAELAQRGEELYKEESELSVFKNKIAQMDSTAEELSKKREDMIMQQTQLNKQREDMVMQQTQLNKLEEKLTRDLTYITNEYTRLGEMLLCNEKLRFSNKEAEENLSKRELSLSAEKEAVLDHITDLEARENDLHLALDERAEQLGMAEDELRQKQQDAAEQRVSIECARDCFLKWKREQEAEMLEKQQGININAAKLVEELCADFERKREAFNSFKELEEIKLKDKVSFIGKLTEAIEKGGEELTEAKKKFEQDVAALTCEKSDVMKLLKLVEDSKCKLEWDTRELEAKQHEIQNNVISSAEMRKMTESGYNEVSKRLQLIEKQKKELEGTISNLDRSSTMLDDTRANLQAQQNLFNHEKSEFALKVASLNHAQQEFEATKNAFDADYNNMKQDLLKISEVKKENETERLKLEKRAKALDELNRDELIQKSADLELKERLLGDREKLLEEKHVTFCEQVEQLKEDKEKLSSRARDIASQSVKLDAKLHELECKLNLLRENELVWQAAVQQLDEAEEAFEQQKKEFAEMQAHEMELALQHREENEKKRKELLLEKNKQLAALEKLHFAHERQQCDIQTVLKKSQEDKDLFDEEKRAWSVTVENENEKMQKKNAEIIQLRAQLLNEIQEVTELLKEFKEKSADLLKRTEVVSQTEADQKNMNKEILLRLGQLQVQEVALKAARQKDEDELVLWKQNEMDTLNVRKGALDELEVKLKTDAQKEKSRLNRLRVDLMKSNADERLKLQETQLQMEEETASKMAAAEKELVELRQVELQKVEEQRNAIMLEMANVQMQIVQERNKLNDYKNAMAVDEKNIKQLQEKLFTEKETLSLQKWKHTREVGETQQLMKELNKKKTLLETAEADLCEEKKLVKQKVVEADEKLHLLEMAENSLREIEMERQKMQDLKIEMETQQLAAHGEQEALEAAKQKLEESLKDLHNKENIFNEERSKFHTDAMQSTQLRSKFEAWQVNEKEKIESIKRRLTEEGVLLKEKLDVVTREVSFLQDKHAEKDLQMAEVQQEKESLQKQRVELDTLQHNLLKKQVEMKMREAVISSKVKELNVAQARLNEREAEVEERSKQVEEEANRIMYPSLNK